MKNISDTLRGYFFALTAVIGFGATFIGVALGNESFDPITMSFGRVIPGAILAVFALKSAKQPLLPPREAFPAIFGVTAGIVIGFPLLSTLALQNIHPADAGVMVAVSPIVTSIAAIFIGHKKPRKLFWLAAALGSLSAATLAYLRGGSEFGGGIFWGYILMATAMVLASLGHLTGNYLAGKYKSFHVLCWAVIISIPIQLPGAIINWTINPITTMPTASAVFGFLYVSLFSIIIGNYMLNHGFYLIGLVKGSQLQLIQPIVTMILAIVVLHQTVAPITWIAAFAILASVAWSQRLR